MEELKNGMSRANKLKLLQKLTHQYGHPALLLSRKTAYRATRLIVTHYWEFLDPVHSKNIRQKTLQSISDVIADGKGFIRRRLTAIIVRKTSNWLLYQNKHSPLISSLIHDVRKRNDS